MPFSRSPNPGPQPSRRLQRSSLACPHASCALVGRRGQGNVVKHSLSRLRHGVRRRFRCTGCGRTFCSTTGTAYHRIQRSRRMFDWVVSLRMEGSSIAGISRLTGLSWNTVARWLEKAGVHAARFNDQRLRGFELLELQVDELRAFAQGKSDVVWIFTAMEVSSRLWPALHVGRRSYRATMHVFRDMAQRCLPGAFPLITTDGFAYYKRAVRKFFGGSCVFGQVIKTLRKNRVTNVDRRHVGCTLAEMEAALEESEDSNALNTSFIERMNLVIRQGSAYLTRRAATHARSVERLTEHMELFRCFYNFIRPHGALRFGREVRTPAQQAGLASRSMAWRDIFSVQLPSFLRARMLMPDWTGSEAQCRPRLVA